MTWYRLGPEVAGGLGPNTVLDRSSVPPRVTRLHYVFDGWLGDALVESYPCFLLTESAAADLSAQGCTGYTVRQAEISVSDTFEELYPSRELPAFRWLDVHGIPLDDDLGTEADARLVVSQRALDLIRGHGLDNCEIEPITAPG